MTQKVTVWELACHVTLDGPRELVKERWRSFQGGGEGAVVRLDEGKPRPLHSAHASHVELAGLGHLLEDDKLGGVVEQR